MPSQNCRICRRRLRDQESIKIGIGPVCFEKITGRKYPRKVVLKHSRSSRIFPVVKPSGTEDLPGQNLLDFDALVEEEENYDTNRELIEKINAAYKEAEAEQFAEHREATKRFEKLLSTLPDEVWVG